MKKRRNEIIAEERQSSNRWRKWTLRKPLTRKQIVRKLRWYMWFLDYLYPNEDSTVMLCQRLLKAAKEVEQRHKENLMIVRKLRWYMCFLDYLYPNEDSTVMLCQRLLKAAKEVEQQHKENLMVDVAEFEKLSDLCELERWRRNK